MKFKHFAILHGHCDSFRQIIIPGPVDPWSGYSQNLLLDAKETTEDDQAATVRCQQAVLKEIVALPVFPMTPGTRRPPSQRIKHVEVLRHPHSHAVIPK